MRFFFRNNLIQKHMLHERVAAKSKSAFMLETSAVAKLLVSQIEKRKKKYHLDNSGIIINTAIKMREISDKRHTTKANERATTTVLYSNTLTGYTSNGSRLRFFLVFFIFFVHMYPFFLTGRAISVLMVTAISHV